VQFSNYFDPSFAALATPLMAYTGPASAEFFIFPPTPAVAAPPNPDRSYLDSGESFNANSYAGFGQIDWKITSAWKFTGGLRYTYDDKSGYEFLRELCVSCANFLGSGFLPENLGSLTPIWDVTTPTSGFVFTGTSPGAGPTLFNQTVMGIPGFATRTLAGHWSALTGTAGLEWSPDPDLLTYLKYSRGYKAGGFNGGSLVASPEVGPETLDDVEGGVKKTFGGRLSVDLAGFYYWYHNMQIELGELGTGGTTTFFLQGVPLVTNWGAELEANWRPTDDLNFILSYAYLNTRIAKSACYQDPVSTSPSSPSCVASGSAATGVFNVTGNQLIDSPPNKVAINANYTLHFEPGKLTFSISNIWTDGHFSALFNTPDYFSPGYNELDLRALWNDAKDRYTVILFAKNVLNAVQYDYIYPGTSIYATGPNAGQPTSITHALNAPVTYGVQLQVRWK
jgi:iron complex outermembrane receptor protein